MSRSILIRSIFLVLAGMLFVERSDAQETRLPTEAEVKALQSKFEAERQGMLKKGIDKRFPPDLLKKAEDLAQRADKALADGRLFQAREGYRQARWMLPYQPPQVPAEHVAWILGNLRLRHDGEVTAVAFSPDGRFLASASKDRTVKIWDLENGHERLTYTGHADSVSAIAFSPDGKIIASGAAEPDIHLWDPLTGKEVRKVPGSGAFVYTLAFTPDGKYLMSGQAAKGLKDKNLLCVHETGSWKLHRFINDFRTKPHSLSFSPDGAFLAVATSDGEVRLFDYPRMVDDVTTPAYWSQQQDTDGRGCQAAISPDNRTLIRCGLDGVKLFKMPQPKDRFNPTAPDKTLPKDLYRAICVAFSKDGKTFVVGCDDGAVRQFDTSTAVQTGIHKGHGGEVNTLCFNAAGTVLASAGGDHIIRLWQEDAAVPSRDFAGHEGSVWKSSFNLDGRRVVSASADRSVRIWDVASGKVLHTLTGHNAPVTSALFSPDGKFVASAGGDRVVKIWDAESGKHLRDLSGHTNTITCLDFSRDGKKLVSGCVDRKVKVWDYQAGKELVNIENNTVPAAAVFSPDGKQIATGNVDATIKFYDAGSGKLQTSWSTQGASVTGLAYSPDGNLLASSGADQLARVWTVAKPGSVPITLEGHKGPVSAIAFRKDNKHLATCGSDMVVRLWKLEGDTGKEVQTFRGHKDWLTSVNFSADGFYIISSGVDRVIKISEITTRDAPIQPGQGGNLLAVAVSPDGKLIASGGTDGTIKIWDRATGSDLATLVGHEDIVTTLVFSADSKRLVSGSLALKFWDVATAREIPLQPDQLLNWTKFKSPPPLILVSADGKKLYVWEPQEKFTTIGVYDLAAGARLFSFDDRGREVRAVSFSANGKAAALAAQDGTIRLFDMDKKGQGFPGGDWFLYDKEGLSSDVALSPDGAFLVSGSTKGELKICKVQGKEVIQSIQAHAAGIQCCLVSPDGKRVASAGQDNVVKLWDLESGKALRSWSMQPPGETSFRRNLVTNMAFTPDGKQLVTSNANTTLYVLELP